MEADFSFLKGMKYLGQYVYPPRPGGSIHPQGDYYRRLLHSSEWLAQAKMNGQNTQVKINEDGTLEFFNRHHKECPYVPTEEQASFLRSLKVHAPVILNLELLDKQTKTFKKTLYVYDVLVFRGEYLVGTSLSHRLKLLEFLFPETIPTQFKFARSPAPNVWVAQSFEAEWDELFRLYSQLDIFEGVVLKRKNGILEPGFSKENNGGWSIRCRKVKSPSRPLLSSNLSPPV